MNDKSVTRLAGAGTSVAELDHEIAGSPATMADAFAALGIRQAIGDMDADDVSLEVDATSQGDGRSTVRLRLRAYRRRDDGHG
jgi:hypothetical protein